MFEIENSSIFVGETDDGNDRKSVAPPITTTLAQTADSPRKIVLPRRPGESRFAPPQYYYPASRRGVMPGGYDRS
jgi:hypothetical protein